MNPSELSARLGKPLDELEKGRHPAYCVRYDYAGQYALDESGEIIALNLRGTALAQDPGLWLAELPRLHYLNLSECGLTTLSLPELPELMVLNASRNAELRELNLPGAFPELLRADLSHCRLQSVEWPESPVLEFLNASRQEEWSLVAWSFAAACPRLYYLDLSHNLLTAFSLGAGFENLGFLCLEQNQLTELTLAGELPGLESLRLKNNRLETVAGNWFASAPNLLNIFLEENPLEAKYQGFIEGKTPHEAVGSLRAVLANEAKGMTWDNECKVLLIGNGKAGKSCLVHRLKEDEFLSEWDSTHAVELLPYQLGKWELMLWDFGGQDIYHATHRLFMQSDAVYLLLWNRESDPAVNEYCVVPESGVDRYYRNYGIDYWVHYARVLGKESPIIILQSFRDEDGVLNLPRPQSTYQTGFSYFQVHQIDSEPNNWEENGYEDLLRYLERAVRKIKTGEASVAKNFAAVRRWLREEQRKGEKTLSLSDYLAFVSQPGIELINPLDVLSSWLHKTGVVYYQPGKLADQIILDQVWAIRAIYSLFDRKQHYYQMKDQKGIFTGQKLIEIWSERPENDPELFLKFMLSSDICFELTPDASKSEYRSTPFEKRTFLAPGLLTENKPDLVDAFWTDRPSWQFKYHYEFLHFGVIQSFIVQTNELADTRKMWQSGTFLKAGDQVAVVEASGQELRIRVTQNGKPLLDEIRSLLQKIQDEEPRVLLSHDEKHFVPLERVKKWQTTGNPQIEAEDGTLVSYEPFKAFWEITSKEQRLSMGDKIERNLSPNFTNNTKNVELLEKEENLGQSTNAEAAEAVRKILFITANPTSTAKLQLAEEYREVQRHLEGQDRYTATQTRCHNLTPRPLRRRGSRVCVAVYQDRYRVHSLYQVNASEFIDGVCEQGPYVLHFSGHGERGSGEVEEMWRELAIDQTDSAGLILYDRDKRQPELLSTNVIRDLFQSFKDENIPLEVVVFNACHSVAQAEVVSRIGFTVIGTVNEIDESAAIEFSNGFYRVLSQNGSLEQAIRRGRTKARTAGLQRMDMIKVYRDGKEVSI